MNPLIKYGVPAAAGLAAGGYALSKSEDPGSAILAGGAGLLGGAAGLKAGQLAGKYAPDLLAAAQRNIISPAGNVVGDIGAKVPKESNLRNKVIGKAADIIAAAEGSTVGPKGEQLVKGITAGLGAPAAAGLAGLGGVALGAVPGAMGIPGFQQQAIDPESYGSSNSLGARYKAPTMQYV